MTGLFARAWTALKPFFAGNPFRSAFLIGPARERIEPALAPLTAQARSAAASPTRTSASPADVFTPTRPRAGRRTLVGRQEELARILEAICDEGAHVVLYAERGRGKTSLSNLAIEGLRRRGGVVVRHACEASSTFDTIMHSLAAEIPSSMMASPGADASEGCDALLPERPLRPGDLAALSQGLSCTSLVFVIDEFDRVEDVATRTRLADTIKLVSDRELGLHFMIVGVSATLEDIIGQHISIQRNISAIHLPLLEDREVAQMIEKGGEQSGIRFSPEAVALVVGVARGMPYMAQLLGLRIAQSALQKRRDVVTSEDLMAAVERLLGETASGVVSAYRSLTSQGRDEEMAMALLRIVEGEQDRWGRVKIEGDGGGGGGVIIGGRRVSAALWMQLRNARLLVAAGGEPNMVQFADRAMVYYVELLAARTRLISEDQIEADLASGASRRSFARGA